jgi:hypothetical protein
MLPPAKFRLVFTVALACSLPGAVFASTVSFSKVEIGFVGTQHADLNNDGREDFVSTDYDSGAFEVVLSTGDGAYAAPVFYTLPGGADSGSIGIGDFNADGNADLVVWGTDNAIHLFLNNGSGKFSHKAAFAVKAGGSLITVGDFNHDGIMDLALTRSNLTIWFGNGKSGFTTGPSTAFPPGIGGDYVLLGDFDGDGNADLAFGEYESPDALVLYGNSTGHFPNSSSVRTDKAFVSFAAADVNGDGKMDIIATQSGSKTKQFSVFYGNSARTWNNGTIIPTTHVAIEATAADVNGDGINDLIVHEIPCDSAGTDCVSILTRNANGTYNPQQTVANYQADDTLTVVRATRNTKPDISLGGMLLLNTTPGKFPSCAPPNAFEGIHVCSPAAGSTVASPVTFAVGAAGQVAMRKAEVWVDGKKLVEQLNGFSGYTFLNHNLSLAKGTHRITIFAAGWDNSLQEKKFSLTVK